MKQLIASVVLILGVVLCWATPEEMERFHKVVELKPSSKLFKADCMTCHLEVPAHNSFGKDVKGLIKDSGQTGLSVELWSRLAKLDSDKDGWSNGEEVLADTLPGNAADHPVGVAASQTTSSPQQRGTIIDQLLPRHSLHPVVIHFPIALFLFGVAFELIGTKKRDSVLRQTGWWGLLLGTVSTAIAIPTGVAVLVRSGYSWSGPALTHAVIAGTATALMISTTLWRREGEIQSKTYFALLLLAAIAVALAGHFGGQLVYGN